MEGNILYRNARVFYRSLGEGPPVLFLHGCLESSAPWTGYLEQFAADYRVLAIDLPGHGHSELFGAGHAMDELADAVASVLGVLEAAPAVVVGHSLGGYLALALGERHPEQVKGLCLFSSTPDADTEEKRRERERDIQLIHLGRKALLCRMLFPGASALRHFLARSFVS